MAGNITFISPHLSDEATLTPDSEAATMEAANLLKPQPTDIWLRPGGAGQLELLIDLGASWAQWDTIFVGYLNADTTHTWNWRSGPTAADTLASGSPTWSSGEIDMLHSSTPSDWDRPHALIVLDDPATEASRWLRMRSDAGNYPSDFEAGRLMVATGFQPSVNFSVGAQPPQWREAKRWRRTEAGVILPQVGPRNRVLSVDLAHQTPAQALNSLQGFARRRGTSQDLLVLWSADPTALVQEQIVHGLLTEQPRMTVPAPQQFRVSLTVEEMI